LSCAQATTILCPVESRANAIAVVEPLGGAIVAIDEPSPLSQAAVFRMMTGAP
jgi:hypothetical protein